MTCIRILKDEARRAKGKVHVAARSSRRLVGIHAKTVINSRKDRLVWTGHIARESHTGI
jgi:hypothetical protein